MNIEYSLILSMLEYKNISKVIGFINEDEFKIEEHKKYFNFIKDYYKNYLKCPSITTLETEFNVKFEKVENIEQEQYYIDKIIEKNNKERILDIAKEISEKIVKKNESCSEISDYFTSKMRRLNFGKEIGFSGNMGIDVEKRLERYHEIVKGLQTKYKWGLDVGGTSKLDIEVPIVPGRLIGIQARPGVGKSFLLSVLSSNLFMNLNLRILFISMEMSVEEVQERIDAFLSGISYNRLKNGKLGENELKKYEEYLQKIKGNENFAIEYPKLCDQEVVRGLIEKHQPNIVFVDYLQLMKDSNKEKDKRLQVANIVYELKRMAGIYKIPIVFVSATNRAGSDDEEAPTLENLKDSDDIGFASDAVISLYRNDSDKIKNIMNLAVVKNRHGKDIKLKLMWDIDESIVKENYSSNE